MVPRPIRISTLVFLFAGTFGVFGLFGRGALSSVDEAFIYETTRSLVRRGTWTIQWRSDAPPDRTVSRFSLVPSLWAAPFFAASQWLVGERPDREQWILYGTQLGSCAATASAAVLLAHWLAGLGHSPTTSIVCSLLLAFGSLAFPYSSTLFPQVVTTPILLWCCRAVAEQRARAAGLAFALVVCCRLDLLLLWPALALAIWQQNGPTRRAVIGMLSIGGSLGFAGNTAVNWARGDPLLAGAYTSETFTTPLWIGFTGLFASAGKGLLWFSPLACAGLLAIWSYARRMPVPGRLLLYVSIVQLVVIAKWWAWHGSLSWGPRLLLPILPICMFPIAGWLSHWHRLSPLARRGVVVLAATSLVVNSWSATQPQIAFLTGPGAVYTEETESYYVPQTGPFGVRSQEPTPWLWRAPRSGTSASVAGGFGFLAVLGLAGLLGTTGLRWRLPKLDVRAPAAAGALLLIGNLPWLLDALGALVRPTAGSQYRQMEPIGDGTGYRGRLRLPLRGRYVFYTDADRPVVLRLDGRDVFRSAPWGSEYFESARAPVVEIRGRDGTPGVLRWTIPGGGMYKQPIPADYLLPVHPSAWQRCRIVWRHYGWLAWIPLGLLAGHWVLRPADGPERPPKTAKPA